MAKVTYGDGTVISFGGTPTEADIEEAYNQVKGSSQESQLITPTTQEAPPQEDFVEGLISKSEGLTNKPVSTDIGAVNNLIMGLIPNDRLRLEFLSEKFEGQNVSQDEQGNILLNGDRINPQGFDFGDILRGSGIILPAAGQIGGGMAGATAGSIVPGAGTLTGAVTGGVGGAIAGQGANLAIIKAMGIDPTLLEASGSLAKEGAFALGGEAIGRGIGAGANAMAKTPAGQALGQFWKDTSSKLGKGLTKQLAKFVGSVDKDAVEVSSRVNYQNLIPEYFKQEKTSEIAKNTLFGTPKIMEFDLQNTTKNGLQKGTELLAKSIKDVNDSTFDNFIKQFTGISDETIDAIKSNKLSEIINSDNLSKSKPVRIAGEILSNANRHLNKVGEELGKLETEAIKLKKGLPFATDDIASRLDRAIKDSGLLGRKRMAPGFQSAPSINVKGKEQILQLRELFGQKLTDSEITRRFGKEALEKYGDRLFFYGQKVGQDILHGLDTKTAQVLRKRMDILADSIFENQSIPSSLKRIAYDTVNEFRNRYHNILGIKDASAKYSSFKNLLSEARIDKDNVTNELINRVNKFGSQNTAIQDSIDSVLKEIPSGSNISKQMRLLEVGNDLKQINSFTALKQFEGQLNSENVLRLGKTSTPEQFITQADNLFKSSNNPRLKSRKYFDDAQLSLAAKKFVEGSSNLLRVGAVRSLLGIGSLGGMIGGPVGAAAGGIASLSLSNPQNIAKILKKLGEQKVSQVPQKSLLRSLSNISSKVTPTVGTKTLKSLSESGKRSEQEKKQ